MQSELEISDALTPLQAPLHWVWSPCFNVMYKIAFLPFPDRKHLIWSLDKHQLTILVQRTRRETFYRHIHHLKLLFLYVTCCMVNWPDLHIVFQDVKLNLWTSWMDFCKAVTQPWISTYCAHSSFCITYYSQQHPSLKVRILAIVDNLNLLGAIRDITVIYFELEYVLKEVFGIKLNLQKSSLLLQLHSVADPVSFMEPVYQQLPQLRYPSGC